LRKERSVADDVTLYIDVKQVRSMLLADGWHIVAAGTFEIGGYEYRSSSRPIGEVRPTDHVMLRGGDEPLMPTKAFRFKEEADGRQRSMYGPVSSILAVRYG